MKALSISVLLFAVLALSGFAQSFKLVEIGSQDWMAKNLNVDKFRNGDPIPEAQTNEEWLKANVNKQPAWCHYNNDPANGIMYGKLYNWYAVNDERGLAPEGWHLPRDEEWTTLTDFLGGEVEAGKKMKRTSGWKSEEGESGNGSNSGRFSGLPGGYRNYDGAFDDIGYSGYWWSSTQYSISNAWVRSLFYFGDNVGSDSYGKGNGFSVRCLKD